ncbi:MAG: SDR family oxidoreductase [Devosia sp.]|uniref:SDR family oxidoreductase n=1 Tax=Devosia sp. TaxID=1871048 RepID=UPI0024C929DC|nr:SDR family oxidoreductase [Devosia sp.]UYO00439.1 MAG: SDR family oxidoreductase [Devosia sp.]
MSHKTAFVTGASRGIGAAIARKILTEGYGRLYVAARDTDRFAETILMLRAACKDGQEVVPIYGDFSKLDDVQEAVKQVLARKENIDVLVNNAGFTAPNSIFEATVDELEQTFAVNLRAPFYIVQQMLREGNTFTHIVNIASTAGVKGRAGWATYSASKAAMISFSESIREELAPLGTRVICLSPGRCATDLRRTLAPEEDPTTIMQPESVADVVALTISAEGRFMDTENIVVRL